jgi:DNA-binding response OmpR family regulator
LTPHTTLLLVEDDERLAPLVQRHLVESGFIVRWARDSAEADKLTEEGPIDLAILDIMLPGEDGLSLCRRLRKGARDIGIIMVTARGEESDRIMGLSIGADDYLTKPFSLWELEARIKAVLRRCAKNFAPQVRIAGPLAIDIEQRTVAMNGERIELTRSEFDLLAQLTSAPGMVFTRERLLETIQGGESEAFDRAVDTHIGNLRRKIETDPKSPRHLKTVWGVGYRFEGA